MAVAKVALSLPASLLSRIDRHAKKSRLSRSAFVREVMERSLRQPHEDDPSEGAPDLCRAGRRGSGPVRSLAHPGGRDSAPPA